MKPSLLVVMLAAGGCDRVFGLVRDADPPICGPFGPPEAVMFDPALADARDFSVDASGTHGMVYANLKSGTIPAWRGPHAIKKRDDGVWIQDPARDKDVLNSLDGAHIQPGGDSALGWTDLPRAAELHEYNFVSTAMKWSQNPMQIDGQASSSPHAGNVIASADGNLLTLTEILVPADGPSVLQIRQKLAIMQWVLTSQANLLLTAKPKLAITGSVMTKAHDRMVYTANVGGEKVEGALVYRIFAGTRDDDLFLPGVELSIAGFETGGYSEPWIDEDCTTLYFRRDDTTWMTTEIAP